MEIDVVLLIIGGSLLVLGLLSRLIKRVFLSAVLLALLIGVVLGPEALGVLDPPGAREEERKLLEHVARVTLAIALMGSALQITRADVRENRRRAGWLLTVAMVGMWAVTGLGGWLLLDLPFWAGFLLGAILTPTDPVVSSAIVTGPLAEENLPRRLRRTLQLESGANDGLALPFVLLAGLMLTEPAGTAFGHWAERAAVEIGIALAVGGAAGWLTGRVAELSFRQGEVERSNLLGLGIALALGTLGGVHLLGGSGVLAVFVAALVFSTQLEEEVRDEIDAVQEAVTKFFVLPVFILFGAMLPWREWEALGLAGLAFVVWVLLLRRPPVVPLALAASGTARREIGFLAWFGPLGVAAIYYATYMERFHAPDSEKIFAAATLAICASVVVHSLTATPALRRFAGRSALATLRRPLDPDSEKAP